MRLKNVYPDHYGRHYPDSQSLNLAKREWAKEIGRFNRDQIDEMFTFAKSERIRGNEDFLWMDIGRIIAIKGTSWQHAMQSKPVSEVIGLPRKTAAEYKAQGREHMAKMRAELGI